MATKRNLRRIDSKGLSEDNTLIYDERHPLYLGTWKRSIPYVDKEMAKDDLDEPHVKRKLNMLQNYPQIQTLYGREPVTFVITAVFVAIQLYFAYYFGKINDSNWLLVLTAYVVGGTATHIFGVVIHEACHNLIFKTPVYNRFVGFLANVGIVVPIAASFKRYHLEHHAYQGVEDKDPDLPLSWEIKFCKGNMFFKFLFLVFYPVMYVIRGAAQQKKPSFWEVVNVIFTISTDAVIVYSFGWRAFIYLALSLWLGYSLHPAAAHFIQEHFTFQDGQETYSYYGSLNKIFMNIGYHNEHHDFTKIAWTKLPALRAMCPEYYNNVYYHMSWVKVLVDFVIDGTIGPQSRVERDFDSHKKGRKMINTVHKEEQTRLEKLKVNDEMFRNVEDDEVEKDEC